MYDLKHRKVQRFFSNAQRVQGRYVLRPTHRNPKPSRDREGAVAPTLDLTAVDEIIHREGTTREAAIPILQAIQAHYRYLPDEALARVCELTEVTPAQIAGGRSRPDNRFPLPRITARRTALISSRTFPGQSYRIIASDRSSSKPPNAEPSASAAFRA